MKEIKILDFIPIVVTKDKTWKPHNVLKPGSILCLPPHAILIKPVVRKL
jgi:hypothetical protein